jgi:hypothetical protein
VIYRSIIVIPPEVLHALDLRAELFKCSFVGIILLLALILPGGWLENASLQFPE